MQSWILMNSSKEHNLFEIEIFCNIINIFTATFDQLKVAVSTILSLLNKIVHVFQNILKWWTPEINK